MHYHCWRAAVLAVVASLSPGCSAAATEGIWAPWSNLFQPRSVAPSATAAWAVDAVRGYVGSMEAPGLENRSVRAADFVRVQGTSFVLGCDPFYPVGWNTFSLLEMASEIPCGSFGADYAAGRGKAQVIQLFDAAQARGLRVVRTWAFTVVSAYPFQVSPNVYDETMFRALDWVLAEAGKRSIRVFLVLADWWTVPGGVQQYVRWSRTAFNSEAFFADRNCIEAYKRNALSLIMRRNTVTGVLYRDDPTIAGWELINEPRWCVHLQHAALPADRPRPLASCSRGCGARMQRWIEDAARFIALHDRNHLRTVGMEGFWKSSSARFTGMDASPAPWSYSTGQDFHSNHAPAEITHTACHAWPANWAVGGGLTGIAPGIFMSNWLAAHIADARELGKPLILSEFGHSSLPDLALTSRDAFFHSAFSAIEASVAHGQPGAGDLFWHWYANDDRLKTAADQYAIYDDSETMRLVEQHAAVLGRAMEAGKGKFCSQ